MSEHGKGRLRVEHGAIGNAAWHLPHGSPWMIYWNGPGAPLLFGSNKTSLDRIRAPEADGEYRSFKEASAAVSRFWSGPRKPRAHRVKGRHR